jgi:hypothetical protein
VASPAASRTAARKAGRSQRLEAFLGFEKCLGVIGVEVMPSITGVIHHDLGCHADAPFLSPGTP